MSAVVPAEAEISQTERGLVLSGYCEPHLMINKLLNGSDEVRRPGVNNELTIGGRNDAVQMNPSLRK